jgi:hypothetical protein
VNYGEFAIALGDPFNSPSRNFMLQNGDITDFEMKVPISISGRILMSDRSTLPASLFISAKTPVSATNINRAARRTMSSRTEPDTGGKFTLLVYPGDNAIAVESLPDSYAVESITYGSLDVNQNALHLTALPNSTIAITLSHTVKR